MATKITVDPITRIEGHLKIDVEIKGGKVSNAWSSGQMWRGLEVILKGRHPNDAWFISQRSCGVCTTVHAVASVRAVENALGIKVPLNAQYIRNLITLYHGIHDHIVHFYHLSALDWVDVVSATTADPARASDIAMSLSNWPRNSEKEFRAVQDQVKDFVAKGRLGIFANGYWGHPAMKLPPEVNLIAVAHYLQALEYQRYATQAYAILGGKNPHIQNLTVGGVTNAINPDGEGTLNMERLIYMKELIDKARQFVYNVYLPDIAAVGSFYPEWLGIGGGVPNYLAVPDLPLDEWGSKCDLPGGTIVGGKLESVRAIKSFDDKYFQENVAESIAHSWYKWEGEKIRHPWQEETEPNYTKYDPKNGYSWVKAPRFKVRGKYLPMQVGPAAQVLVGAALKDDLTLKWVDAAVGKLKFVLENVHRKKNVKLPPTILMSTLGRHASRAIRTAMFADLTDKHWNLLVQNIGKGDLSIATPVTYPSGEVKGFGFHEAPRGCLSHWVVIEDGLIKNYQQVVPSTWNAGPRDEKEMRGPYEESLVGNPVQDEKRPLEVLRTIHSFDPCLACAIHLYDPDGGELTRVRAL